MNLNVLSHTSSPEDIITEKQLHTEMIILIFVNYTEIIIFVKL
jgi:hypothetical protein